jgi:hypothetical protein
VNKKEKGPNGPKMLARFTQNRLFSKNAKKHDKTDKKSIKTAKNHQILRKKR